MKFTKKFCGPSATGRVFLLNFRTESAFSAMNSSMFFLFFLSLLLTQHYCAEVDNITSLQPLAQQPNRNTTALQPLSSAVLRKKPKGPEDGEPSNQANRNTTTLQPLFPAVLRKKPKGSAIRTPGTIAEAQRLSVKFLHPYPTTVLYYLRLGKFEVFKVEEEFGMPPVFVESQRWRETSSNNKEVVYHHSVLADEQATVEE
ncbi:hypothetical protein ACFX1S_037169 [Malus domestica]